MTGTAPGTPPATLPPILANIPAGLPRDERWVCWKWEYKPKKTGGHHRGWDKPPINPASGRYASTNNPETWGTFAEAIARMKRDNMAGIGFNLLDYPNIVVHDLDNCLDPGTGAIRPQALTIVRVVGGYWEVSPSASGVRGICWGKKVGDSVEAGKGGLGAQYDGYGKVNPETGKAKGRYITLTGHLLPESTPDITDALPGGIEAAYALLFPAKVQNKSPQPRTASVDLDDTALLAKMFASKNGGAIKALWDGATTGHGDDDSKADFALLRDLRFWFGADPVRMERLFSTSALGQRPKWTDRQDYRQMSIAAALKLGGDVYNPRSPSANGASEGARIHSVAHSDTAPTESIFRFFTGKEIASATPGRVEWVAEGLVALGAITEIDGKVKVSGKTTLTTHMCRKVLDGAPFIGRPTTKTSIVYLTEQPLSSFRVALERAGLLDREDFHVLTWASTFGQKWEDVARAAVAKAQEVGACLIVVDTLGQFAGIRGDAENSSGAAMEAIEPLQLAAASGMAVVVTRHDRKGQAVVGESARGSSAFAGAVDIIIRITRFDGNPSASPNTRVLECLSRYDETPDKLVIELRDGEYIALGTDVDVKKQMAIKAILLAAPTSEDQALKTEELCAQAGGVTETLGKDIIKSLAASGQLRTTGGKNGKGVKGNPILYWRDIHSVTAHTPMTESAPKQEFIRSEPTIYKATESISADADEEVI